MFPVASKPFELAGERVAEIMEAKTQQLLWSCLYHLAAKPLVLYNDFFLVKIYSILMVV